MTPPTKEIKFATTINGKEYEATYLVENGLVTVSYKGDRQTTQLGGSSGSPRSLAISMLIQMVNSQA